MSFFSSLHKHRIEKPHEIGGEQLAVYGFVHRGPLLLTRSDLERRAPSEWTMDVGAFAPGESGPAVRLKVVLDLADPYPETLYIHFEDRSGEHRVVHFVSEVRELAWIGVRALGGVPFRLIVPGVSAESGRLDDLAAIQLADAPDA